MPFSSEFFSKYFLNIGPFVCPFVSHRNLQSFSEPSPGFGLVITQQLFITHIDKIVISSVVDPYHLIWISFDNPFFFPTLICSRSIFPFHDTDPDPAKWYGSDRIRILTTGSWRLGYGSVLKAIYCLKLHPCSYNFYLGNVLGILFGSFWKISEQASNSISKLPGSSSLRTPYNQQSFLFDFHS